MCCITKGTHGPELQSRTSKTRRDTGGSNVNLVGLVSPGTKQPTRKADPRSAHTRSTFQPQNSTSQSINSSRLPSSGCHHDRVFDMQIVITTWLSHPSQPRQCGHVSCQFMGSALAALASPGRSCSEDLAPKNCVSEAPACILVLLFPPSDLEQRTALCAGECRKNEQRGVSQNAKCLGQGLGRRATVLQPKESDFSNRERHSGQSFSQSINPSTSRPRLVQAHLPAPGPWARDSRDGDPNQTGSTAPTSNAARVRTIVSRCRGRLTVPAYPHLQNTAHQWADVSASSPPFRAGAVAVAPLGP